MNRHIFRRRKHLIWQHKSHPIVVDEFSSDAHVVSEVILGGMYDSAILESAKSETDFHYLNLGANIGAFDIRVLQLLGQKRLSGMSIEMNPSAYARLVLNLELNEMRMVRTLNVAVWDKAGTTRIGFQRDTGQRCVGEDALLSGVEVRLMDWNTVLELALQEGKIDLLKIDVEGAKERIVACFDSSLSEKIRNIVIETHGSEIHRIVANKLETLGFTRKQEEPGEGNTFLTFWSGK